MTEPQKPDDDPQEKRKRFNRWLAIALVAAVAAGILLASSVWQSGFGDSDEPATNVVAAKQVDREAWCAAQSTYDDIRRELFRRAAQVRGSDEQAYARLSDFALLRINAPIVRGIDDRLNSVSCSGTAVLNLPPNVQVSGGRRSLTGDIDYLVQPAADGTGNVVRLGNVDSITVPLATLSRSAVRSPEPAVIPGEGESDEPADETEQPQPEEQPQPQPVTANPSFDCGDARSRSEIAVCGDPGLASLDRQMASQFNRALTQADRKQRRLLERTRDRFLSYRDRCGTNQCIAETYRSRMREISDIMADRWRG